MDNERFSPAPVGGTSTSRGGSHRSGRDRSGRDRSGRAAKVAATLALLILAVGGPGSGGAGASTASAAESTAPAGPTSLGKLGSEGRWLTDSTGRVVHLNGVNLVAKGVGETPEDLGFGADDAEFLVENGFDVVRLGTTAASLMPEPGVLDTDYYDSFEETVDLLTDAGLLVLVDLHQDGWGPTLGSDGFPEWMTITHGAENTGTGFPLYYVTNPAIQAAFDSFWANEPGPGGVPLQDRVATMFTELARRLGDNPGVMGYDLLNEPWPGTVWEPCATDPGGCPAQDALLDAYHARMTTAIRAEDPDTLIFGEPYVLFNFGGSPTNISRPGGDPASGMSFHVYALDASSEVAVVDFAEDWSTRTGGALLNTEFGATLDPTAIDRQVNLLDGALMSWMWWAYNENVIDDDHAPPTEDNLVTDVIDTLVRPHPRAVAGTPTDLAYDLAERVLRFRYSTDPVAGALADGAVTELQVAPRTYPVGYKVKVTGGTVTSPPDAALLTVVADGAGEVFVKLWPADQPEPPDEIPAPEPPPSGSQPRPATPAAQPITAPASFTG